MNYFSDFLGISFLFALWLFLILMVVNGVVGLIDYLKNTREWKH